MSITLRSALEIFTNADDLYFGVDQGILVICFGPKKKYRHIVTGKPGEYFRTKEDAIHVIEEILTIAIESSTEELQNKESFIAKIFNPENLPPSEWQNVLTKEKAKEIIAGLREHGKFQTFK